MRALAMTKRSNQDVEAKEDRRLTMWRHFRPSAAILLATKTGDFSREVEPSPGVTVATKTSIFKPNHGVFLTLTKLFFVLNLSRERGETENLTKPYVAT